MQHRSHTRPVALRRAARPVQRHPQRRPRTADNVFPLVFLNANAALHSSRRRIDTVDTVRPIQHAGNRRIPNQLRLQLRQPAVIRQRNALHVSRLGARLRSRPRSMTQQLPQSRSHLDIRRNLRILLLRKRSDVDRILHHTQLQIVAHLLGQLYPDSFLRLIGRPRNMRRQQYIFQPKIRRILQRLRAENIQRRPRHLPRLDRLRQRLIHDQFAARAVHNPNPRLHNRQRMFVDQTLSLRSQSHVQRKKIRLAKNVIDRHQRNAVLPRNHGSHKRIVPQQIHPKRLRTPSHFKPNPPQPDNAQRLAAQLRPLQRLLVPLARMHRRIRPRNRPRHRNHQPQRQLRHRNSIRPRRIHHHNSAPRSFSRINIVDANASAPNNAQLRSRSHQRRIGLHRRPHNQRISISQLCRQAAGRNLVGGNNVPAGFFKKNGKSRGRDFFSKNDLQGCSKSRYAYCFQCSRSSPPAAPACR